MPLEVLVGGLAVSGVDRLHHFGVHNHRRRVPRSDRQVDQLQRLVNVVQVVADQTSHDERGFATGPRLQEAKVLGVPPRRTLVERLQVLRLPKVRVRPKVPVRRPVSLRFRLRLGTRQLLGHRVRLRLQDFEVRLHALDKAPEPWPPLLPDCLDLNQGRPKRLPLSSALRLEALLNNTQDRPVVDGHELGHDIRRERHRLPADHDVDELLIRLTQRPGHPCLGVGEVDGPDSTLADHPVKAVSLVPPAAEVCLLDLLGRLVQQRGEHAITVPLPFQVSGEVGGVVVPQFQPLEEPGLNVLKHLRPALELLDAANPHPWGRCGWGALNVIDDPVNMPLDGPLLVGVDILELKPPVRHHPLDLVHRTDDLHRRLVVLLACLEGLHPVLVGDGMGPGLRQLER